LLLLLAGLVMLAIDGLHPYRVWWRRQHWEQVDGRLLQSYQQRRRVRHSGQGSTPMTYVEQRPQKRIFEAVVERGWPLSRRKQVYRIRLNYTYLWKNKKHTRVADSPDRDFESRPVARRFLRQYVKDRSVEVWVDPEKPSRATAFLLYRWSAVWVQIGLVATALGLLWLIVALVFGRTYRRTHRRRAAAANSAARQAR